MKAPQKQNQYPKKVEIEKVVKEIMMVIVVLFLLCLNQSR
jgi:hypothetical protein